MFFASQKVLVMEGSLLLLRIIGGLLGIVFIIWAFARFRLHIFRRHEFLLMSLFGLVLLVVSVNPDSINIIASMLSMKNTQFGRLITLLILSNLLLWFFVFGLRNRDFKNSTQFDLLIRRLARDRFLEEYRIDKDADTIKEITVIIPALDEAENMAQLLPGMPKEIRGHALGVLVVDDGSIDDTSLIVKKLGFQVVANPINRGGGAALRLGYDIALSGGAKIIVTMDGDGQHMPEEIQHLVDPILKNETDIVIGSRILGKREKDSSFRWVGIHVFNFIINMLAGTHITDCSNGFRAFRVDALEQVFLIQDQFHTAELIIDAARKGLRIGEAPITVKRRFRGQSKKGKNLSYGFSFAKTVLKTWWRPK